MIESILYKTAIYCRLSLDDGSLGESGSIQTQKMMLKNIVVGGLNHGYKVWGWI